MINIYAILWIQRTVSEIAFSPSASLISDGNDMFSSSAVFTSLFLSLEMTLFKSLKMLDSLLLHSLSLGGLLISSGRVYATICNLFVSSFSSSSSFLFDLTCLGTLASTDSASEIKLL